ncbi:MAG: hypothetical protein IT422_11380 [Pirellulaceae bacterium]|jgi:hypothetical protein|nr:hypothetical protein [Pirellulaceae bacterium]
MNFVHALNIMADSWAWQSAHAARKRYLWCQERLFTSRWGKSDVVCSATLDSMRTSIRIVDLATAALG